MSRIPFSTRPLSVAARLSAIALAMSTSACATMVGSGATLPVAGASSEEIRLLDSLRTTWKPTTAELTVAGVKRYGVRYVPDYDIAGTYAFALDESGEPALTLNADGSATMHYTGFDPVHMQWWVLSSDLGEPIATAGKVGSVYTVAMQYQDSNHVVVRGQRRIRTKPGEFDLLQFAADDANGKMFILGKRARPLRAGWTQRTGRGAGAAWVAPISGAAARRVAAKLADDSASAKLDETNMKNTLGVKRTDEEKLEEGLGLATSIFGALSKERAAKKDNAERMQRRAAVRHTRLLTRGPDLIKGMKPLRPSADTVVIPQLNAKLASYGFFSSPQQIFPLWYTREKTATVFEASTLAFVAFQMNFVMPAPTDGTVAAMLSCTHYDAQGEVIKKEDMAAVPGKNFDAFSMRSFIGQAKPGLWEPGVYLVQCSVDGRPLVNASFDVVQ